MIPFNKPPVTKNEIIYLADAIKNAHLSGDGEYTKKCHLWLETNLGVKKALLTHSCTAALEMAAILVDIQPGDEVIMPAYTFVSTANAFVLRGGVPVFVDIRPDTQNIDETKIEAAITSRTKAIVPVHYAGVPCEMDVIMSLAKKYSLIVIEDAAQAILSKYKSKQAGSIGHMAALSFHATKNIVCGEGGALLINDESFIERAEIIREKGTNRKKFLRGEVDKYSWVDIGSSYLPSELNAAMLLSQLESAQEITADRLKSWKLYKELLREGNYHFRLQGEVEGTSHNAHMFYIILNEDKRQTLIDFLINKKIKTAFHYICLSNSQSMSRKYKIHGEMHRSQLAEKYLLRLPLFYGLGEDEVRKVSTEIFSYFSTPA
jgi:dTDP-4-amino-4,6-dideoxygalactose transaminase